MIALLLSLLLSAQAEGRPTAGFGGLCNGVADDGPALILASAELQKAGGGNIVVPGGRTCVIASNVTTPAKVNLVFEGGGILSISNGFTLTITGGLPAATFTRIFAGAGSVVIASNQVPYVYPQWWGALGDAANDDTAAIQAAIVAARSSAAATSQVSLLPGHYKITDQLNMFKVATTTGYEYLALLGSGMDVSTIRYYGPATKSAIRMMGAFQRIQNLSVAQYNGVGWVAGISYDGVAGLSRSTHGHIEDVNVNCGSLPGDGIALGRGNTQADMLELEHPYIQNCTSGSAIATFNGNVLSINVIAPTIGRNLIGVAVGVTTNLNVFGGEFDNNGINFVGGCNSGCIFDGIRSEGSKRTFWSGVGAYPQPVTLRNYTLQSIDVTRPATTGTAGGGTPASLTLSTAGFVSGDSIVIAGAGVAAANLHAKITSMASPTAVTINPAAATAVSGAPVTLDGTVEQHTLEENGLGPYIHIGNNFNTASGATAQPGGASQIWIGNTWVQNTLNPYGVTSPDRSSPRTTLIGNLYNRTTPMADRLEPVNGAPALSATTAGIGGVALAAGACTTGTVNITGASTGMVALATPQVYPGDTAYWRAKVTAPGVVTVYVCAATASTPAASPYNVRVIK